jgi:hypothetical protein
MLEVFKPASQSAVNIGNNLSQATAVAAPRFGSDGIFELLQAKAEGPAFDGGVDSSKGSTEGGSVTRKSTTERYLYVGGRELRIKGAATVCASFSLRAPSGNDVLEPCEVSSRDCVSAQTPDSTIVTNRQCRE